VLKKMIAMRVLRQRGKKRGFRLDRALYPLSVSKIYKYFVMEEREHYERMFKDDRVVHQKAASLISTVDLNKLDSNTLDTADDIAIQLFCTFLDSECRAVCSREYKQYIDNKIQKLLPYLDYGRQDEITSLFD